MPNPPQKTLLGSLSDFLFGEDEPAQARKSPGKPAAPQDRGKIPLQAASLPDKLPAGTLQLIGLSGIRNQLGDEWPQRSEQIFLLVESVFKRRLDITDAYYKVDDESFLILFTRLGRQEAAFKAKVIADEIQKLAVGELPTSEIIVSSTVAEVDRSLVMQKINSLQDLVEYVRNSTAGESTEDDGVTFFHHGAEADPERNATTPRVTGAGPDLADLDQSLAGLFQKKTIAAFLKECQAGFQPSFSLKRQQFTHYETTVTHIPSGRPAHSINDPFLENPTELPFQLDRYILTTSLLGLHRMLTSNHKGVVVMPVTYETLATSKLRDVYFARLKEVPSGLTKFIGMTVHSIPAGTPASRIAEVMAYIQPFSGTRVLRVAPDFRLIDLYAGSGCHGFETWVPLDETDMAKRFQMLSSFTKRAGLHRMECILSDATSHDDVSTAVAVGFTFVLGDAVAPIIETPGYSEGLRAEHILRQAGSSPGKT